MFILKILVGIKLLLTHPMLVFGFGRKVNFLPLEEKLLGELSSRLSESDRNILKSQLQEINLIDRVTVSKTVISFSKITGCKYNLERNDKFSQKSDEYKLAAIDFKIFENRYRAIFYIVYGNFYSIEFTSDMSKYFLTADGLEFE